MIKEWIIVIVMLSGALFMLLASLGLIRLPDIYTRMHAATKAPTLGLFLMLVSLCLYFTSFFTIINSVFTILFLFLTIPVASHMIARAAHRIGTPKWKATVRDDLENARDSDND